MTATGFAEAMEAYVRASVGDYVSDTSLNQLFGGDPPNFKPWYSPKWMYEPVEGGVDRVFLGLHPAINPCFKSGQTCDKRECHHEKLDYVDDSKSTHPYSEWLDSNCWGSKGETHQTRARKVFKSLYGKSDGIAKLRFARCTNVCPMRTTSGYGIPQSVWDKWCKKLLKGLSPKTIICNGYQDSGDSPWATVTRLFHPQEIKPVCFGKSQVKLATMSFDGSIETLVMGIRYLNRSFSDDLCGALEIVANQYDIA